jgi:hypothetical protein
VINWGSLHQPRDSDRCDEQDDHVEHRVCFTLAVGHWSDCAIWRSSTECNVQLLCESCNRSKGASVWEQGRG